MSFGRPGGALDSFRVLPPDRGSFPLDHDGESPSANDTLPRYASKPIVETRKLETQLMLAFNLMTNNG